MVNSRIEVRCVWSTVELRSVVYGQQSNLGPLCMVNSRIEVSCVWSTVDNKGVYAQVFRVNVDTKLSIPSGTKLYIRIKIF